MHFTRLCCHGCSNTLTENMLNRTDFEKMKSIFYEDVMVRNNTFINSNPEELADFERVLQRQEPFDYVIDGLNVMFNQLKYGHTPRKANDSQWPNVSNIEE